MRVLAVSNLYPPDIIGDYQLGCAQVVTGLCDRGHEVTVLTSAPRRPAVRAIGVHRRLQLSDVSDPDLGHPRSTTTLARLNASAHWVDSANVYRLLEELEDVRPDVVYLWNILGIGGLSLLLALQQMGIPVVWHLMEPLPALLSGPDGSANSAIARIFLRNFEGTYIAASTHLREEIRSHEVRLTRRVEVIPNWVTTARPGAPTPGHTEGPLRILMVSRLTRDEGIDIMVRAVALLRGRGIRDFIVDLYGPLVDQSLPDLVQELNLGEYFHLLSEIPQEESLELYRHYDLLSLPVSSGEPFGFAALEAASWGCPLLVTDTCVVAEWLVGDVHCIKAKLTDKAFAAGIERAIQDRGELAAMAARAQRAILRDFHLDAILPRIERVLAEVAATAPPAGGGRQRVYRIALLADRLASAIIDEAPEN